ncbi:binding [Zea mays]|uniref:Condensin-1 complex subunit CAP-D2 n=1 Tax=Zea mays TaxID=4577 RepID=A0A1D6IM63_MAIZE|nr:binding [Zea mays]
MSPPFVFPSTLRDLELDTDGDRDEEPSLRPQNPVAVATLRAADLEEFVKGASFDLSDKELFCIEEQEVFDAIYSIVRDFNCLPPALKFNIVETLRSNLSVLLPSIDSLSRASMSSPSDATEITDRIASHRNALKIYSFFLISIVLTAEAGAESCTAAKATAHGRKKNHIYSWNWEAQRGRIMSLVANSLEANLSLLFGPGGTDERYLSFVSKCTFVLCENQNVLKDEDTRNGLCRIIGAIATKHQRISQISASVSHLIHKFDFTVPHLAEAVASAEKKFGDGSLAISLIREIGRADPKEYTRDSVGADNVGRFLVELADRLPKLMSTNIGVLIPHFGGESYKIRNALVGVLGKLAAKAFKDVEGDSNARLRSKQAMLEILIERCRDVSAYTRSRVLQVWSELCEENSISIGLWNEVASVASGRLEDKSAIVRKSALQLLITMLQHNPFGPQLRTATFEATLEKYKEKLQGMEPSNSDKDEAANDSSPGEVIMGQDESVSDSCLASSQDQNDRDATIVDITNLEQIRALVASLEAGLRFSKCITSLMPILVQLLASSSATDVENTILLLMRCRQFQIEGSEAALRKIWYGAADKAISTIYTLHPAPELFATETAKKSLSSVFSVLGTNDVSNGDEAQNGASLSSVSPSKLGRFLFVISHIALNHLVYIENSVRKIQKQKRKNEKSQPTTEDLQPDVSKSLEAQGINAELGLSATIDIAIESLAERAEKEIVCCSSEKNLIGHCGPFLSKLCRNLALLQKFPDLQASAMLALCRLMIIDAEFCEANLQILFTVAESAPSETVRSNCTIALGDLAVRFPNLLDPWTEYIYARLRDPSVSVRKNAVLVISHLILNDMMKVKGYINEMAVRIEDKDERISSLAKLFFHELSKKGSNPIYNLLPDILGRLCNQHLKEETFCNIMQFLINSIKKDKQMEALVDKLCNRFAGVNDVRQWEYISYCLSQLTFTEKGLKKLIDNFKMFEHALSEDSVMNHFRSVISKCKKFAKPELKICIEEFEEKLSKVHQEKKEQEETTKNAEAHRQRIDSLDEFLVTKEVSENSGNSAEDETSEVVDPSVDSSTEHMENTPECSVNTSAENSQTTAPLTESEGGGEEIQSAQPVSKGMSRLRAKKTRDPVVDPSVDRSTEYKGNTPEHSADTSTENSQTSVPLTGTEGGSEEIQSTQPVGKGVSRSRARKTRDPVVEDSAAPVRRATRSTRRQGS